MACHTCLTSNHAAGANLSTTRYAHLCCDRGPRPNTNAVAYLHQIIDDHAILYDRVL
jgi:hypothetical protein